MNFKRVRFKTMNGREIRPIAICIFYHNNKILVFEGFDKVKNEFFYRHRWRYRIW